MSFRENALAFGVAGVAFAGAATAFAVAVFAGPSGVAVFAGPSGVAVFAGVVGGVGGVAVVDFAEQGAAAAPAVTTENAPPAIEQTATAAPQGLPLKLG